MIATVNQSGIITGKRPGKVTIIITNQKGKQRSTSITVKKAARKPILPVTFDEIKTESKILLKSDISEFTYRLRVKNLSDHKIRKIIYTYKLQINTAPNVPDKKATESPSEIPEDLPTESPSELSDNAPTEPPSELSDNAPTEPPSEDPDNTPTEPSPKIITKKIKITLKKIAAGKKSAWKYYKGKTSGKLEDMRLIKIELYAKDALYISYPEKEKFVLKWGTPDTEAPVFSGELKKKSIYNGEPFIVYYSDKASTYKFQKDISAVDAREGKVKIKINTSNINWKKTGIYKIKFSAKDSAGNTARSWRKVQVIVPGTAEKVADDILSSITKANWSDTKKARTIYGYIRKQISYISHAAHSNYRIAGLNGLRQRYGDCYTFYSIARLLLTRAGIPNMMIKRFPARPYRHFWNLIYVNDGWYHFDTCPRRSGKTYCILTDAQMHEKEPGNTFAFQTELYPKRSKKVISHGNPYPRYR